MRGLIVPTSHAQAVARARSILGALLMPPPGAPAGTLPSPLRYRIEAGHNGGSDPLAKHPGSPSYGDRVNTADCSGFLAWSWGFDRFQPGGTFLATTGAEYVSTDSIWRSARRHAAAPTQADWFGFVDEADAVPGDGIVYPGHTDRSPVGHCGLVSGIVAGRPQIIDCSLGQDQREGHAVSERGPELWLHAGGRFVRYLHATPF